MKQLIIICITIPFLIGCIQQQNADDISVNAEIISSSGTYFQECHNTLENLNVKISILNKSDRQSSFWIYLCSWNIGAFRTDNNDIGFCFKNCSRNFPIEINLEPNQSITFSTILQINKSIYPNNTFKIGFIKLQYEDFNQNMLDSVNLAKIISSHKTYWSNLLSLQDIGNTLGYKINK
jgi:hypothetical protein